MRSNMDVETILTNIHKANLYSDAAYAIDMFKISRCLFNDSSNVNITNVFRFNTGTRSIKHMSLEMEYSACWSTSRLETKVKQTCTVKMSMLNISVCLAFDFCRFCVVIRFFYPRHNCQWPPTSKDFYTRSYPLHYFLILILGKEPVFPFSTLSAKQGSYRYHFYKVFGMSRSLTGDWTRDLPYSMPQCVSLVKVLKTLRNKQHLYLWPNTNSIGMSVISWSLSMWFTIV